MYKKPVLLGGFPMKLDGNEMRSKKPSWPLAPCFCEIGLL